jgi:hypothetical protein
MPSISLAERRAWKTIKASNVVTRGYILVRGLTILTGPASKPTKNAAAPTERKMPAVAAKTKPNSGKL